MTDIAGGQDQFTRKIRILFGERCLPENSVLELEIVEQIDGNTIRKTISAKIQVSVLEGY